MDTPVVTIELVGEESYRTDPDCRRAVDCRLPVADFIQYLLGEKERALAGWLECERLSKSSPILKTAAKRQEGKQTGWSDFLDVSPAARNPKPGDFLDIDREAGEIIVRNISELGLKTDNLEDHQQGD